MDFSSAPVEGALPGTMALYFMLLSTPLGVATWAELCSLALQNLLRHTWMFFSRNRPGCLVALAFTPFVVHREQQGMFVTVWMFGPFANSLICRMTILSGCSYISVSSMAFV